MKFGVRLFLAYFVIVGLGIALFLYSAQQQLQPAMRQASEETLVDTANLLAEIVAPVLRSDTPSFVDFQTAIRNYERRELNAQIWSLLKTEPDFEIYVTNLNGIVLYHSNPDEIGADYSEWRDVVLTLQGEYGARTSGIDPATDQSSMYVAAPIYQQGDLVGVLTVSQPNASTSHLLQVARQQLWMQSGLILLTAMALALILAWWLSKSINQITRYVEQLGAGERAPAPKIRERELNKLAKATAKMAKEIDGKEYVEDYIYTLTHELKSPISAIQGAAELLNETDMPEPERKKFLANINDQSHHLRQLIDELLELASVEKRTGLRDLESINLLSLVQKCAQSKKPLLDKKQIKISVEEQGEPRSISGEHFLLQQAVSNLLDNAIDFCPETGRIQITVRGNNITIHNQGESIPEYALPRIFERFYSLARPNGGKKSSGLGLSFVKEVAELHRGTVKINNDKTGVKVQLILNSEQPR